MNVPLMAKSATAQEKEAESKELAEIRRKFWENSEWANGRRRDDFATFGAGTEADYDSGYHGPRLPVEEEQAWDVLLGELSRSCKYYSYVQDERGFNNALIHLQKAFNERTKARAGFTSDWKYIGKKQ